MGQKSKKRLRLFFIIVYLLLLFFFLLVSLVPFLDPGRFWFIAMLGMVYPFLLMLVLLSLVVGICLRSRWSFLALAALLLSWQQLSVIFRIRSKKEFHLEKPATTLRVLSWNVSRWTENKNSMGENQGNSLRSVMIDLVQMQNADVLCFQEFFECYNQDFFPANIPPFEKMGYKYHYFSPASKIYDGAFQTGLIIFSRYPILDSAYFNPVPGEHSEGFSYVDIGLAGQTVRLFNTHLESAGLNHQDYNNLGSTEASRNIISKIKRGYRLRSLQAGALKAQMQKSPHPVIFCGDIDDVPNSYAYFKIKGDLQDVFLQKGSGFGRTFGYLSPTLRIDYMMADKRISIQQFEKLPFRYSDHYPMMADFQIKK
jgi:endonuclease/exonuclease/phosphatase family metal-dependent hydrolase